MINGILESKNNAFSIIIIGLLLFCGCKNNPQPKAIKASAKKQTNIRFATKADDYQEKKHAQRLTTDKTEITSKHFQMEGPAWENENVAFRNYFDARNGMDIYGKRTTDMVLDSVGIDEDYHALQDWGMDILKVGNSLGAGAIGMVLKDSIYRLGRGAKGSFRILEEEANSSKLEFLFEDWVIQDRKYTVTHTISINSGTHFYEGNISVEGLQGDESFVTGIVDHGVSTYEIKTGNHTIFSTHGKQEVEGLILGMAIAVADDSFNKTDSASNYSGEVDKTHLVHLKGKNMSYKFFAGWELQNAKFKSQEQFEQMITNELKI